MEDFFTAFYEDFVLASQQVGELLELQEVIMSTAAISASALVWGKAAFVIVGAGLILWLASAVMFG